MKIEQRYACFCRWRLNCLLNCCQQSEMKWLWQSEWRWGVPLPSSYAVFNAAPFSSCVCSAAGFYSTVNFVAKLPQPGPHGTYMYCELCHQRANDQGKIAIYIIIYLFWFQLDLSRIATIYRQAIGSAHSHFFTSFYAARCECGETTPWTSVCREKCFACKMMI